MIHLITLAVWNKQGYYDTLVHYYDTLVHVSLLTDSTPTTKKKKSAASNKYPFFFCSQRLIAYHTYFSPHPNGAIILLHSYHTKYQTEERERGGEQQPLVLYCTCTCTYNLTRGSNGIITFGPTILPITALAPPTFGGS